MIPHARFLLATFFLLSISYVSRRFYLYYYHTESPLVQIIGLQDETGYKGDVCAALQCHSPYKIANISMWLDDKQIHKDFKINRSSINHPVVITQQTIPDGEHSIKFEVVDGTKNQNKTTICKTFYTDNLDFQAKLVPLASEYKVQQGRCLYIQMQANKSIKSAKVSVFDNEYSFFPEKKNSCLYEAIVPVECEQEPGSYPFVVKAQDRLGNIVTLENSCTVQTVAFKKRVLNVAGNRLESELEFTNLQEQDLEKALETLSAKSPAEKLWSGPFDVPIMSKGVTTEFGVIRTSQQRGRRVHKALDLIADPKSVIWANANGVVVLKDRFTHSGNTVVIDHGCGILSMYYHLHDFADIHVGQKVKKGHPLGRMGMTGYASGDHLHWEIRINNIAVDPMQWTLKWN